MVRNKKGGDHANRDRPETSRILLGQEGCFSDDTTLMATALALQMAMVGHDPRSRYATRTQQGRGLTPMAIGGHHMTKRESPPGREDIVRYVPADSIGRCNEFGELL